MNLQQVKTYLAEVDYRRLIFHVGEDGERLYLQLVEPTICTKTGKPYLSKGRKWLLSPHMTKSEVINTAFKAVMTYEEHETRERFKYKGKAIFGPHFDVDALAGISEKIDVREPLNEVHSA